MKLKPLSGQPGDVQLSASALDAFFVCPARLKLMSQYTPKCLARALQDGGDAHKLLAGEEVSTASPTAVAYYESLYDLKESYGVEVFEQEFTQEFYILPGVWYKRIIDGLAAWQGLPYLIDWKTSSKGGWPFFRKDRTKIVPKAMGWQAVSYLIPPPQAELDRLQIDRWPDRIMFLISDPMGHGEIVCYNRDEEMEANFLAAAKLAADAIREGNLPYNYGNACGTPGASWSCPMINACFQVPGWEDEFEVIGKEVSDENVLS